MDPVLTILISLVALLLGVILGFILAGKRDRSLEQRVALAASQGGHEEHQRLVGLLEPFSRQVEALRHSLDASREREVSERSALRSEVQRMEQLNRGLQEEAQRLSKALSGNVKVQGNWGEQVLERVLELSGLKKNRDFFTQWEGIYEDQRYRPDVVIALPQNRHIIIDSKLSLVPWQRLVNSDDETEKAYLQKELIKSMKQHIAGLSSKPYSKLEGLNPLDTILLFVPIEALLNFVQENEPQIIDEAGTRSIVLVGPTTLLLSLKTVDNLWVAERQRKSVSQVVRLAGSMVDKLALALGDLDDLGNTLAKATEQQLSLSKRLSHGRGSVEHSAQKLVDLGIPTSKAKRFQGEDHGDGEV